MSVIKTNDGWIELGAEWLWPLKDFKAPAIEQRRCSHNIRIPMHAPRVTLADAPQPHNIRFF
jgi:hypothetical protein